MGKKRYRLRRKASSFATLTAVVAALALVFAGSALADGTYNWNGVNGLTACAPGTQGTMLWIFNPHSSTVVPGDLTVTWGDGTTVTYPASGWINPGGSQNWHYTVDIPNDSTAVPPTAASVAYTGDLGNPAILTISGCNEGGGGIPPAADLTVDKTASQSANTEYTWSINKAVNTTEIDPTPGGTATFNYTVTLSHDGGTTNYTDVTGTITVGNPNDAAVTLATITDQLSDGTTCTVDTSGDSTLSIPANGSVGFPYSCGLSGFPSDYPNTTNTATVTWLHQVLTLPDQSQEDLAAGSNFATVAVVFSSTVSDNCATAKDTLDGTDTSLGTHCVGDTVPPATVADVSGTFTFTYSHTFPAPALGRCATHNNSASFVDNSTPQDTGHSDQSVQVCTFNKPLTIGYWQNHLASSNKTSTWYDTYCAKPLNGTGCSSNGPWTKQFLPQSLGNYVVSTVSQAASVFVANNCSNSSTSTQNAVGCLAAQLLAAELNKANIAKTTCIDSTITAANNFLIAINYTGPTASYTLTSAQRATAVSLASSLNTFNNFGC
jgi:hypothetical protein